MVAEVQTLEPPLLAQENDHHAARPVQALQATALSFQAMQATSLSVQALQATSLPVPALQATSLSNRGSQRDVVYILADQWRLR